MLILKLLAVTPFEQNIVFFYIFILVLLMFLTWIMFKMRSGFIALLCAIISAFFMFQLFEYPMLMLVCIGLVIFYVFDAYVLFFKD